ncbi:putative helicase MOV-10 [Malaya genurostris]|uniref:putative helicase MOV-10 n=1 Tax=Malaya genurostris TaxID=325434 RepID=UPI0026F3BE76|nr:putative helicase MOV-10 [Malaya genurostris]XP_058461674.1 putative helicase MOV-10 [Malaya genurostris]
MESSRNNFMQQRFNRQKHEIESFVVRIYRHNLIKDGGIIKRKLREKLFEEIKLRRITRIKMDELGWVLMNHDLITRNRQPEKHVEGQNSQFKFNMERLRELMEKHEQDVLLTTNKKNEVTPQGVVCHNEKALQDIRDLIEANCSLASISHVTTFERLMKHNFEPSSSDCFVCRKSFRCAEDYSKHFDSVHGVNFRIEMNEDCFKTGQKLDISHHYDALNPVTPFTIRNTYHMALHVECVYLYHTTKQLMPINRDVWPITINPGDTYKFTITSGMFLVAGHDYTILIHFSRILQYVEQYYFRVLKEPVELRIQHTPIVLGKLGDYPPPSELIAIFKNNFKLSGTYSPEERKLCEEIQSLLNSDKDSRLKADNYVRMLQLMNNIEDYNVQYELSQYEMNNVSLEFGGQKRFYSLQLSQFGTAPKSLVEGDYVELSYTRPNKSIKTVIGVIAQIYINKVLFETEEPLKKDIKWRLKFNPNRTPIRMEYQALEIIKKQNLSAFFFPSKPLQKFPQFSRKQFQWFNCNVDSNEEQQIAVVNIINETARPAPYILFGPPGTGKTSTLVEAIAQIWKLKSDAFILVTASSNFACNELTERLLRIVPKSDVFRFFSKQAERMLADMSYGLIECSNLNTGSYRLPSKQELYEKRIVISTLTTTGRLIQAKIRPGHFSYVFIDECGSATEASALVPIAGVITSTSSVQGSIILSGDPLQLGPITRSEFATNMGLNVSMLERLMALDIYLKDPQSGSYNSSLITKLVKNYRSHAAILHFSNNMFYQNELIPSAPCDTIDWALSWKELPSAVFPIIFESTMGSLAREPNSTSYFNRKEIELVNFYLDKIITNGINDRTVSQEEIGIVSPYKKQCVKLKQMCQRHGWNKIDVGSVEAFQGREKPIMILTTVRSGTSGVGFLSNVKRLNVALTRAKALLIVIGNPETLQQDPNWYEFIRYCFQQKAIRGVKFELDEERHRLCEIATKDDYLVQIQQKLDMIIKNMSEVKM